MASINYTSFFYDSYKGNIDVDVDTFKLMLVTSSYVANKDHAKRSDITNEVGASGSYAAGGGAVTVTPNLDTTNDRAELTFGNVSFTTATITAAAAVIYKSRGGASSADELVAYLDFGGNITSTAGTFTVTPSAPLRVQN